MTSIQQPTVETPRLIAPFPSSSDPRRNASRNGFHDRRDSFLFVIALIAQLTMLELLNIPCSSATDKKIWDDKLTAEDEGEWVIVNEEEPERAEAFEVYIDRLLSIRLGVLYVSRLRRQTDKLHPKLLEMIRLFPCSVLMSFAAAINPFRYDVIDEDTFSDNLSVCSYETDSYEPDYEEQKISQYLINYPACGEKGYLELADINLVAVVAQWSWLSAQSLERQYEGQDIATKMMFWAIGANGFFQTYIKFARGTEEELGVEVLRSRMELLGC